jgi:hypothetical protein
VFTDQHAQSTFVARCRSLQWQIDEVAGLSISGVARPHDSVIGLFFTDLATVENMAGDLFSRLLVIQSEPWLIEALKTFIADERRHAQVALHFARQYSMRANVACAPSTAVDVFYARFLRLLSKASPEVSSMLVTVGEVLLDNAILSGVSEFLGEEAVTAATYRINRDEARHVALDLYLLERHCELFGGSSWLMRTVKGVRDAVYLARTLAAARPLLSAVFGDVVDLCDPMGSTTRNAFRKIERFATRPIVRSHPVVKLYLFGLSAMRSRVGGPLLRPLWKVATGLNPTVLE